MLTIFWCRSIKFRKFHSLTSALVLRFEIIYTRALTDDGDTSPDDVIIIQKLNELKLIIKISSILEELEPRNCLRTTTSKQMSKGESVRKCKQKWNTTFPVKASHSAHAQLVKGELPFCRPLHPSPSQRRLESSP